MTLDDAKKVLADLKTARAKEKALRTELDVARESHTEFSKPYDEAITAIDKIDSEAQELYVQIEIEKRGLTATRMAIDLEVAKLNLAEANRKVKSGKRALKAGAMSQTQCDALIRTAQAAKDNLDILKYRYEIASRPPTKDIVANKIYRRQFLPHLRQSIPTTFAEVYAR